MTGRVLNIQKFSIDDGPGIRTTVFLKGCNLHCLWCHNPESISPDYQIQFFPQRCIKCLSCSKVCPAGAHFLKDSNVVFARELCRRCQICVEVCHSKALVIQGKSMTTDEVIDEVIKDRAFYENSGGGVTFSGGEPLLQKDFLVELLKRSKNLGLHTAVDTAGNVPWKTFQDIMEYVDLYLYDVKMMDRDKHKLKTGVENGRILSNLEKLVAAGARIHVRVPVIPGVNDNIEEMGEIASFLQKLDGIELIELLPYHGFAESKYESLGAEYTYKGCKTPNQDLMKAMLDAFLKKNLNAKTKIGV